MPRTKKKNVNDDDEMSSKANVSFEQVSELVRAASSAVLLPDLQKFNGEGSTAEAKEWLRSLEAQATIAGWNEKQKLETARRMLERAAKSWYLLNADDIESWKDFRKLFYESFVGEDDANVVDKFQRFNDREQKDDESAVEYILEKLRLGKDIGASVPDCKNAVCAGLTSSEMASYLRGFDYKKSADYLKRVREFQTYKGKTSEKNEKSSEADSTAVSSKQGDKVVCYNCNEVGDHLAKNCPKPKKPKFCSNCKSEGHRKSECTVNGNSGSSGSTGEGKGSEEKAVVLSVFARDNIEKAGQKYIKTAFIGEKVIENTLIDQGSRVCVIQASTAILLRIPSEECNEKIYGVGDFEVGVQCLGRLTVPITIDNVTVKTEVLIVSDNVLPARVLR
ncbi:uncharacterized protein LOC135837650 [Planococcus citri]|uniref:uncharacterized protein LOC135837650 n=1 Tax=Planococcus citri TaxID=170843 RepID=UPI0031F83463